MGDQASVAGTVQLVQSGLGAAAPILMFTLMAPYIGPSSTGGIVYGIEGFNIWLYGGAAVVAIVFVLAITVLRPRPGEIQTLEQQLETAAVKAAADQTLVSDRD